MAVRVTEAHADVCSETSRPTAKVTAQFANVWGYSVGRRQTRVTSVLALAMGELKHDQPRRYTQAFMQVMSHWTPNFEWIDMFVYEEFPYDISYDSIGATKFATDVVVVDSGDDQRNSRWTQPLMEFDVAYGVRTMEQLHGLIAFFRAMRGRKSGFLYKDPVDHSSTLATRIEARAPPPISPHDQIIGTGDGSTKSFQLVKTYPTLGGNTQVRPITKPNAATVQIAINAVTVSNWTLDATTGIVTFTPPQQLNSLPNLTLTVLGGGSVQVKGSANCFSTLSVGMRIVMAGWVNPQNNTTEAQLVTITSKPGSDTIVLSVPAGVGSVESNSPHVTMYVHPAPVIGATITAGYEFWVPVRFDTDRLPVTLSEYGVGGAADVKLVELRPRETF